MRHEQIVDASEHKAAHPMASTAWADVWRVPILMLCVLLFACVPVLIWYSVTHWSIVAQWLEIALTIALAIGGVRAYFYIHERYHAKRMRDLDAQERAVTMRLKQEYVNVLAQARAMNANVKIHESGAFEVQHFLASSTRVTMEPQKQIAPPLLPPPPTTVIPVPTGRELLLSGDVNRALAEGFIILGPGEKGGLKTLKIKRCFSTLVSGLPSVGKTTTVFWIVSQLILIGAKLWIVDPHMHFEDEDGNTSLASELDALSDSFVFPPCDGEPDEIIGRVKWMYSELCHRQQPGYIVRADQTIIGIMDEFNTVADSIDPKQVIISHRGRSLNFSSTIALLEREGRKFGLHFMLIAHKWTQRDIGGDNALRTNATTYLCHKLNDKAQAELLMSGGGKQVLALTVGSYWITGPSWNDEPARITTPMISAVDIPLLLKMKQRGHVEVVNMQNVVDADHIPDAFPTHSRRIPMNEDTESNLNNGRVLNAGGKQSELDEVKLARVRQMVQEHKSQSEIIAELFAGMRNVDAVAEYRKFLAALME